MYSELKACRVTCPTSWKIAHTRETVLNAMEEKLMLLRTPLSEAMRNLRALAANIYPGRGLAVGMDGTGRFLVLLYWIMGRSPNSRNRIFVLDERGNLRTAPANPSLVKDPSLIIYRAMTSRYGVHIVTNGDQTDTIAQYLDQERTWRQRLLFYGLSTRQVSAAFNAALMTRCYEPDEPNNTPRISGLCYARLGQVYAEISILRQSAFGTSIVGNCDRHSFRYDILAPELAYCITTYKGDGDPLPAFEGEPYLVPLVGSIDDILDEYRQTLNSDNAVSLAAKFIPIDYSSSPIWRIWNKYEAVAN